MRALGKTGISVNEIGLGGIPIQRVDKKTVKQMIFHTCGFYIGFVGVLTL